VRHRRRRVGHGRDRMSAHAWLPDRAGAHLESRGAHGCGESLDALEPVATLDALVGPLMIPAHFLQPANTSVSMSADELAIARSVVYASLFDYPLTLAQLRQTLIESSQTPSEILALYARSD